MKYALLFIVCLVVPATGKAQNWQCLQPGVKAYYSNGSYLRGIRIDSVRAGANGSTLFYPFRSPRGSYRTSFPQLDTNSGSWVGKTVEALSNGRTLFYNYWNDTLIIDTKADVGSSWTLYSDTTRTVYEATVASKDTMTILGALDSVKRITIQAKQSGINVADSINRLHLLLSKAHGLEQAFDLFMFPYHRPDSPGVQSVDYLTDYSGGTVVNQGYVFSRIAFTNPTSEALYDYQPGDMYQWTTAFSPPLSKEEVTDSIVGRMLVAGQLSISSREKSTVLSGIGGPGPTYTTTYGNRVDFHSLGAKLIVDTTKMPEEWPMQFFYYYSERDTNYGITSAALQTSYSFIDQRGRVNNFEPCGETIRYKVGLGEVYKAVCTDPSGTGWIRQLQWYRKGSRTYGVHGSLSINESHTTTDFRIAPNPANNSLNVSLPVGRSFKLDVYDATGRSIYHINQSGGKQIVDTESWPEGMYVIYLTTDSGRLVKKLLVEH
jgi:hypothetical protein